MSPDDDSAESLSAKLRKTAQEQVASFNRTYLQPSPLEYVLNILANHTDSANNDHSVSARLTQDRLDEIGTLSSSHKKTIDSVQGEDENTISRVSECVQVFGNTNDARRIMDAFKFSKVTISFQRLSIEAFLHGKLLMSLCFYETHGIITTKIYAGDAVIGSGPLTQDQEELIEVSTDRCIWSYLALLALRVSSNA